MASEHDGNDCESGGLVKNGKTGPGAEHGQKLKWPKHGKAITAGNEKHWPKNGPRTRRVGVNFVIFFCYFIPSFFPTSGHGQCSICLPFVAHFQPWAQLPFSTTPSDS